MTMTDDSPLVLIRKLVRHISNLTAEPIASTPENARRLEEVDCLLTSALGLLNEAAGTPGLIACRYRACSKDWCSMLTPECCAERGGNETGSCGGKSGPGLDYAIRHAEDESHMEKGK